MSENITENPFFILLSMILMFALFVIAFTRVRLDDFEGEEQEELGPTKPTPVEVESRAMTIQNTRWEYSPKSPPYKKIKLVYEGDPQIHATRWFNKAPVYEISPTIQKNMFKELEQIYQRKEDSKLITLEFSSTNQVEQVDLRALVGGRSLALKKQNIFKF